MGEQDAFTEADAVLGGDHRRHRDAGQRLHMLQQRLMQGKGTSPARVGSTLRPNCSASL